MLQSTDCFHTVHLQCFKGRAKEALTENSNVFCPTCNKQVAEYELKSYLDADEIKEIENMLL